MESVESNTAHLHRRLPQGARESFVLVTMIMKMVLRKLEPEWKEQVGCWSTFSLAARCYADVVVLVAKSVDAAEQMPMTETCFRVNDQLMSCEACL